MGWRPEDYIVAALAGFVTVFMLTVIFGVFIHPLPTKDKGLESIAQIMTTVLTIISIYIGGKINHNMRDKDRDD